MSLNTGLQVIDTCDLRAIYTDTNGASVELFTGQTENSEISKKTDKIEVWSGIGNNRTFQLFTKPQTTIKGNIKQFNLDWFALKNGVSISKTDKGTFYFGKSVTIATSTTTIAKATRVLSVKNPSDGTFLKLVTTVPASSTEVKYEVVNTTDIKLTFHASYVPTTAIVSYIGDATTGKDNLTIVLDGKSIPRSCQLIASTIAYDQDTQAVVADIHTYFYKAQLSPDYTLTFKLGTPIDIDAEFEILLPITLPDGTDNSTAKQIGKMVITEK